MERNKRIRLVDLGSQSIFIPSTLEGSADGDVFLTLCDDGLLNSDDESQEFLIQTAELDHIKQEENQLQTLQQPNEYVPALQYRLISSHPNSNLTLKQEPTTAISSTAINLNEVSSAAIVQQQNTTNGATTLIPTSMQIPGGCEIYLVKDYVESPAADDHTLLSSGKSVIKIEPDAMLANSSISNNLVQNKFIASTLPPTSQSVTSNTLPAKCLLSSSESTNDNEESSKRNIILEAYKKRDDKRRKTHNEVERRRRDKINSWIFKLKEMLPVESNHAITTSMSPSNNNSLFATANSASCRTPPSDSKSQILIKACEYIKSMQDEVKSLRECLNENEQLRDSNLSLQQELQKLRNELNNRKAASNKNCHFISSHNSNLNVTLNTLNSNNSMLYGTRGVITLSNFSKHNAGSIPGNTSINNNMRLNSLSTSSGSTSSTSSNCSTIINDFTD